MKKICFITMGNIYLAPYIEMYTQYIEGSYSVIYWNRENKNENNNNNNFYNFDYEIKSTDKIKKVLGYIKFRKFVKNILQNNDFDLIIILQTCGALLLSDILIKYYSQRFIIDIRDYTSEHNPIIYYMEKKLFANAYSCVISSHGYQEFLPPQKYYIVHNKRSLDSNRVKRIKNRIKKRKVLNISFIGFVNYQTQHKKLLLNLKNDKRFHLNFIGTRALELQKFCKENNINNVTLQGTFAPTEILTFYENTDFINNLYGNNNPSLDYALSNKLYFAAELNIPILTVDGTYMSQISKKYKFGISIDVDDPNLGNKLIDYYESINWEKFDRKSVEFLKNIDIEQKEFIEMIKKSFK